MNLSHSLLILAVLAQTNSDGQPGHAIEAFRCDFEPATDANFDDWPDGWTRRQGKGYPRRLKIGLVPDNATPGANRCLRIDLDGGAATVYSPPIDVNPLLNHVVHGRIRTEGLTHNVARIEVIFLDADDKPVQTHLSPPVRASDWEEVGIGPLMLDAPSVRRAILALHLLPSDKADLFGSAMFDDLRMGVVPRIAVQANHKLHLYTDPKDVEISCAISGLGAPAAAMQFELLDKDGQSLASEERPIEITHAHEDAEKGTEPQAFAGTATWKPPIPEVGFYRVRVAASGTHHLSRTISLAVIDPQEPPGSGQFGWSLPRGEEGLAMGTLVGLLEHCGIHWLKFPIWFDEADHQRADQLAWLVERLGDRNIQLVGVLDQPPSRSRAESSRQLDLPAASVFLQPQLWKAQLDPVMTRLSLKVLWWQLGHDRDKSFVGFSQFEQVLAAVREHFQQLGRETYLGVSWDALKPEPVDPSAAQFLSYQVETPFTADELGSYLDAPTSSQGRRWIMLEPLIEEDYSPEDRARDLVLRMLAATVHGADAIFVSDPFDPRTGLLNRDGTPSDLFLPWRTTALLTAGAEYLGSLTLPQGSRNLVFRRGDEAVMVVWNTRPTRETIYLGDHPRQTDLWGRGREAEQVTENGHLEQAIDVTALPTFVTGLNLAVARWQMSFQFEKQELASVFGQEQTCGYRLANTFDRPVSGTLQVQAPSTWRIEPQTERLRIGAGEESNHSLRILLPADAASGIQPLRVDFDVTADRRYQFRVYRQLLVGLQDLDVELTTHLDANGNLVIDLELVNKSEDALDFSCLLFAKDRRRQRKQVFGLGHEGTSKQFVLSDGKELLGTTLWLRIEEIGGSRVLNRQIVAAP